MGKYIHPNAPAGGGGLGRFKSSLPLGMNPLFDQWLRPSSIWTESQQCFIQHGLKRQFLIAKATDSYLTPKFKFENIAHPGEDLMLGEDAYFNECRKDLPYSSSAGNNDSDLKEKMNKLLKEFAANDSAKKAEKLFGKFHEKNQ